jgi:hypothetical protein
MKKAALALCVLLLPGASQARKAFDLTGHVKFFSLTSFPYELDGFVPETSGSSLVDARLKLLWRPTRKLRLELHPQLTLKQQTSPVIGVRTGVDQAAGEGLPLSVALVDESRLMLGARFDRASLRWDVKRLRMTLGRQPISFGKGRLFTPLDLVSPFSPNTLDTSYKPGVDALRFDLFRGVSGRVTVAAAYLDDWTLEGSALVANAKGSVGDWELEGFAGSLYGESVLGGSAFYNAGKLGYFGDINITLAEDDPFVRAVMGTQFKPTAKSMISTEVYYQSLGSDEPKDYRRQYSNPRYARGELWLAGKLYAGIGGQYELTPLLHLGGALIANPLDRSFLLMPSLAWNAAENASASVGFMLGLGERPEITGFLPTLKSEFGTLPNIAFVSGRFFF